jgi:hypothetical protein
MKMTKISILVAGALTLAFSALHAGVSVNTNQPTEKLVAFRVLTNKYITTQLGGFLDCSGMKIGSKQKFTLIDISGGALTDGHEVRIRYTPNLNGRPDPSKTSYWREVEDGIKRGPDGDAFKIRRVDSKCALETVSGSFVARPLTNRWLSITNKLDGAMLLELVDLSSVSGPNIPEDLPTLTVAASPEKSTNQPPATAQSAPPPQPPPASP